MITAAVATTGAAADEHLLAEVLWQQRRLSRLGVPEVVADAKYGTTGNFLYLGRELTPSATGPRDRVTSGWARPPELRGSLCTGRRCPGCAHRADAAVRGMPCLRGGGPSLACSLAVRMKRLRGLRF